MGSSVNERFITCVMCGRRIPVHRVQTRRPVSCACGMRIQAPAASLRTPLVTLLLLAAAIVLLTAVAALARHLTG
jgi:hypothetical protein